MRTRAASALALLALSTLALTSCAGSRDSPRADDPSAPITFAATPVGDDPSGENPVQAFAALLSEATGREVEIVDVPDYTAVVEALRNHHVDVGIMSGFPSALAVSTGEVDAIMAWPGNGEPVSTCLVLDDSRLRTLADISPATTVAFADPASSSGYFMPLAMLQESGLTKDTDYTAMFSGGHDMSLTALREGQVDVACTSTIFPKRAGTNDPSFPFEKGETRSLGESMSMPVSVAVLADQNLPAETRDLILEALPQVFVEANAKRLGTMMEATQGTAPVSMPGTSMFQPFVDTAAIAGVDISDLK
ncbi:phosphate/phosphite/phosphonate ABC transporter substrate-binding protein [Leucobacter insecticola]|uniref:Phosphate/phosphite/phosphonate ABC transporter substrate-binding protein n=1 Tax=Leucobacter insecticola TaxID=2714934 RepID=A0A6G8FI68_9MICO|nr:phosphate/phosphite/phosphonate ABC transporter substrate-binding protein [Leucobacter insecticola]QIM16186.1 phosphate/phosphite/phosphonate ABC transporter substrate-binding protein [Leucobacter insecticola]